MPLAPLTRCAFPKAGAPRRTRPRSLTVEGDAQFDVCGSHFQFRPTLAIQP
jgi:hypothetical protein